MVLTQNTNIKSHKFFILEIQHTYFVSTFSNTIRYTRDHIFVWVHISEKSILRGIHKDFPKNTTLTQYFSDGFVQGRIRANNLALVDGEKQHTFQQLDDISTKIASAILECVRGTTNGNPDGDTVIGVCLQSSDRVISILFGILKAGCAYVPFDIAFPEQRILNIIKGCRPLMVICDDKSNVLSKFESAKEYTLVLSTDEIYRKIQPMKWNYNISRIGKRRNEAEETAIVLYTSGSGFLHEKCLEFFMWKQYKLSFS